MDQKLSQQLSQLNDLFKSAKSQKELAFKLGTTPRTIQRWIKGDSQPKPQYEKAIKNLFKAYSPTLKNEEKKTAFTEKRKKPAQRKKLVEKEKKKQEKKRTPAPTEQIIPISKWWDKYMKEYKELPEYDKLIDMIYSRGLKYARFLTSSPTEAMLLRDPNEQWDTEPFIQMIGMSEGYPYDDRSRQLFLRRAVRVKQVVNTSLSLEQINDRLRKIFFSTKDGAEHSNIKQFNAYFFDNINHLTNDKEKTKKANGRK